MKWWNLKYRICEIDLQKFIHLAIVAAMFAQIPITLEYLFAIQFIVFFCGISKNTWKNHQNNNFSFNWLNSDCVCAASHLNEHVQLFSLHAFVAIQFGFYSVLHENHLFFHCSFFYFIFSHSGFLSVSPFIWLRLRMWNFWIRLRNLHFFFLIQFDNICSIKSIQWICSRLVLTCLMPALSVQSTMQYIYSYSNWFIRVGSRIFIGQQLIILWLRCLLMN